jgi:hypothetical protein
LVGDDECTVWHLSLLSPAVHDEVLTTGLFCCRRTINCPERQKVDTAGAVPFSPHLVEDTCCEISSGKSRAPFSVSGNALELVSYWIA